jgi:hypothetical protein
VAKAHEGVFRLQVEDVELVDAGRHDHQRARSHLVRQRRVLDQLEQLVLEDHRAFGDGDVLPDLEGVLVGDGDTAFAQVCQQIGHARAQAFALGFDCQLEHLGVGGREVGRAHGIDELFGEEAQLVPGGLVNVGRFDEVIDQPRIEQVILFEQAVDRVVTPLGGVKASVTALGSNEGLARRGAHGQPRPQRPLLLEIIELELCERHCLRGIGPNGRQR